MSRSKNTLDKPVEVSLALVTSINGKLTNAGQPSYLWASAEDQVWFEGFKLQHQVIVMGRSTYESAKAVIKLTPDVLRVVLTHTSEKYQAEAVPGQLEFSSSSPTALVEQLQERGLTKVALVGGAQIAVEFLRARLVKQLFLTIEPIFFAQGLAWEDLAKEYQLELQLQTVTRLNDRGTLLLHFLLV